MRLQILKLGWTVVAACWLAGCSTLRLAYDNGPTLVWWWLDGYGDFSSAQAADVKDGIRSWFDWHRKAQLPHYAAWLAGLQARMGESITPVQMCAWADEARQLLEPALERALQTAAPWVAGLGEAQLRHVEQRYAKGNDELRRDFLQPDPAVRQAAALQRLQDRAELVYGRLDAAQQQLLLQAVAASPQDATRWLAERQQRQQQTLQALRQLRAQRAAPQRSLAVLRALVAAVEHSPDPDYRAYQQRLREFNCALAARLHQSASAGQRQAARERLQGWQDDMRALAVPLLASPQAAP